jgi:dihydroorotase-like cyclic amidohydrolase
VLLAHVEEDASTRGGCIHAHEANFKQIATGLPGLETGLLLPFDAMVSKGRLGLEKFVELTATAPAKIYNLHPRKGSIAIGADVDIAIWNPSRGDAERRNDARSHRIRAFCQVQISRLAGDRAAARTRHHQ